MIVGTGDIASVLPKNGGRLYFASGVSDSSEKRESKFRRERELLMAQTRQSHLVYFSSLSIYYSTTDYALHKVKMEELVRQHFPYYTIVRLGNITWGTNPHTLLNHIRYCLREGEGFVIQPVQRYVVDEAEFLYWINMIPDWNTEMNIPGRRMWVQEIVNEIVEEMKLCLT